MAQELGVSQSLINLLESGKRNFTQSLLDSIIEKLNITLYEFMFAGNDETLPLNNDGVRETITNIQTVPLIDWPQITDFLTGVSKNVNLARIHTPRVVSSSSFALSVRDDSMQPRFMQDDKIIIDPEQIPKNGDTCIVRLNENHEFKILEHTPEGLKLDVYNKKFPYVTIPEDNNVNYRIIGKVVGLIAKF